MERPWPPPLLPAHFTVSTARASGLPGSRLRDPRLFRPTHGVRSVEPAAEVVDRARAFRLAVPDDVVFSHVTAAQLWGLPLPRGVEGQVELDLMRFTGRGQIRRKGCHGHRAQARDIAQVRGLPVTGLADTWVDLGEVTGRGLRLDDLVVVGDDVATRLIGAPDPGESVVPDARERGRRELRRALDSRTRPRGKVVLAEALGLVRAPVRSAMETRARLMFLRAGFPEPVVNLEVLDSDGFWMLEGDLVWEAQRVIGEYQGADHASIKRRSYDASRSALAADDGWRVLEIYAEDVFRPPRRVDCLRRFARALDLDPSTLTIR
jgi:hypothetical protein